MKKKFIFIMFLCLTLLCGCSMGVELDAQQNNLVAEYVAGVLINHSYNHSNRYEFSESENESEEATTDEPEKPTVESETTEPEQPTGEDESKPGETTPSEDETTGKEETTTAPKEFEFEEILGLENISVKCDGYEITESMDADPEGFFVLDAETGYEFVIVNFILTNTSEQVATINTADKNIVLKARFNKEYKYNNYDASILKNDLTGLKDVEIESGAEYKAVTVFMIPTDVADSIDNFILTVASDDVEGVFTIK